ncbi:methyltransferase [Streptomyces uncialis]|uniref:Methyltransferase n=2 Tax=Streptomyces uncialis TaxID=1048205 RepID=A0A1Q4V2S8_9ACTN|nr:methyltransferase [Streptomyces uncialis]
MARQGEDSGVDGIDPCDDAAQQLAAARNRTAAAHVSRTMIPSERPEQAISTRLVSPSAVSVDPSGTNDYNSFAEAYTAANETNLVNAYYERPAMLALAGEVAGRRILDAGCGSGALFAALRDRGAVVSGFDTSAGMLELARQRLGGGADLQVADLGSALPYADDTFDDVVASLVLHYLEDWGPALAELRRVLRPGGRLIASVDHPFAINLIHREAGREAECNYFDTTKWTVEWTVGGRTALVSRWHRPLHAMIEAFGGAGFRISVISEPDPDPAAREMFPEAIAAEPRFLCFLFFVLHAG